MKKLKIVEFSFVGNYYKIIENDKFIVSYCDENNNKSVVNKYIRKIIKKKCKFKIIFFDGSYIYRFYDFILYEYYEKREKLFPFSLFNENVLI